MKNKPSWTARASGPGLVLALLLLWELSARLGWVQSRNWPPFSEVLLALARGLRSGQLAGPLASTLGLALAGYFAGCLAGVAAGVALGLVPWLERFCKPVVETLRPIPIAAVVPPLILFLGVGTALKVFTVAFSAFFPVLLNTLAGVRDGSAVLRQVGRTLRLTRLQQLVAIVLPGALPALFAGLRTSLALALVVAVVAEMVAGAGGIGYFILQSQYALQAAAMYAAVICLSLAGYALNRLVLAAERAALPWHGVS